MSYYEIPLTPAPFAQKTFKLTLNGARNINILLKLRYYDLYELWVADVCDNTTGEELITGMPLVPGVNLLGQYEYLNIGSAWIVAVEPTKQQHPDNETLGSQWVLAWGDSS
ncbi:MAG: hypothetical protein SPI35_08105 [Porphyromonas sp.]|nr:hypothetical protein [Porphyromonas sp.]